MISGIQICTINKLFQILAQSGPTGIAAVLSTSWDSPDPSRLRGIPYVCRQYRDIDFDGPGAFSDEDAEEFAAFIRRVHADSRIWTVYVCCDAAVSRSPAVFAAIARYRKLESWSSVFYTPEYSPNMLVFRKLAWVLGVDITDDRCDELLYQSRKALRDAIRGQNRQ